MKVLFSRHQNDFEHVYELPSVPRVGELVGLLESPMHSFAQQFVVTQVHWAPDHTAYDVSIALELLEKPREQHTCHNHEHRGRPATRQIMGFWWCDECYWEATENDKPLPIRLD